MLKYNHTVHLFLYTISKSKMMGMTWPNPSIPCKTEWKLIHTNNCEEQYLQTQSATHIPELLNVNHLENY